MLVNIRLRLQVHEGIYAHMHALHTIRAYPPRTILESNRIAFAEDRRDDFQLGQAINGRLDNSIKSTQGMPRPAGLFDWIVCNRKSHRHG